MSRLGSWLRRIAIALLLALLAVAALTGRAIADGREQLALSDQAFDRGDLRAATEHARRSAVLYAPGAPHVTAAYERLIAIATGAEAAGEHGLAEAAWRAVRGAALETRHLWTPHAAELARANENLARLSATDPRASRPAGSDVAAAVERARRELDRDHAPVLAWILVLAAGFVLAALGLSWTAIVGVDPDGKLALGRARIALALCAVGALCWTLAVLRA